MLRAKTPGGAALNAHDRSMAETELAFITTEHWSDISRLLAALWMILGSALGLGGSILLAHGMVPSLVASRDLPDDKSNPIRLALYGFSAVFLAVGIYSVVLFVSRFDVILSLYNRGAQ